jgi:hypothetical protein
MAKELKVFIWDNSGKDYVDLIIQIAYSKEEAQKLILEREAADKWGKPAYVINNYGLYTEEPKVLPANGWGTRIDAG